MSDSDKVDRPLPIADLRAHADLGLVPTTGEAILSRLRERLDEPGPASRQAVPPPARHSLETRRPRLRRFIIMPVGIAAILSAVLALSLTGKSNNASASALFSVLRQPQGATSPGTEPGLLTAHAMDQRLQIAAARRVLSDMNGTLWLMPAANDGVCLVQEPTAAGARILVPGHPDLTLVGPEISCVTATHAATRGVFIGARGLGRWEYGVAPDRVTQVQAIVNAKSVLLKLTNGGFRVPPNATSLTVGGLRIFAGPPAAASFGPPHHVKARPLQRSAH